MLPDRAIFTWTDVGEWVESGSRGRNTFQVVLQSNGVIRFVYRALDAREAVVAIGPGAAASIETHVINLSDQTTAATIAGLVGEVFALEEEIDLGEVGHAFYRTHPDEYDAIAVFADFDLSLGGAFAFASPVRNNVQGLFRRGAGTFDDGQSFGSRERLSVVMNLGDIGRYPLNPRQTFRNTEFNTLAILAQEFGHRWLAFVDTEDQSLLGRDNSHWSFLHNSFGSVMEGNEIEDLGGGRFRTVSAARRYSPLDQYLMGLRGASEVEPWFVIRNHELDGPLPANLASRCQPANLRSCGPYVGLEFSGTRRDVTIDEIISRAGPRVPSVETSQKEFRVAFVLVTQRGQAPRASSLEFLETLRTEFSSYFSEAVERRGSVRTELIANAVTELSASLAASGSRRIVTSGSGSTIQVGYATLEASAGISVIQSLAGSSVRSEAAVPAAVTGTTITVYVERGERFSTGLALVNTSTSDAELTLDLSNGRQTRITLPARNQRSLFVHDLFTDLGTGFLGSLTVRSNVPVGVVALRGAVNLDNEFIITTVPVASASSGTESIVFPQVADGGGYVTELLLLNPGNSTMAGTIEFSFDVNTDRGSGRRLSYEIGARSAWKVQTRGLGADAQSGYATLIPTSGTAPVSNAVLSRFSGTNLKFAAGVPGSRAMTRGVMPGVRDSSRRSALAMVNRGNTTADVRLTAFGADGRQIAARTVSIGSNSHRAAFFDDLISELPMGFEGTVTFETANPVYVISLRTLVNASGDFLMTSMPVIDPGAPASGISYFPQLVDGGNFATEYLLVNTGPASARLQFFTTTGQPLPVALR
ncbi:MAG: hypothetical protein HY646_05135 [Acidobacteria bacterium]|nr:hypothetical protein [Acidobacteriota bacterium]